MVSIDFVAGSHGNFLEFMCNKFIAKLSINSLPFNTLGASHIKEYRHDNVFSAGHYSSLNKTLSNRIIRITFNDNDLLLLSSGAFLRAGDAGIENDLLEVNTYHKLLDSKFYAHLIDEINSAYPDHKLSKDNPSCPRYVLREFFKFGFKDPGVNGFSEALRLLQYSSEYDVFDFPYHSFYNYELFLTNFKKLATWYDNVDINEDSLKDIWSIFIQKQIYKNHQKECDEIIKSVILLEHRKIPKLSLLQESYINGVLEKKFGIEMPFVQNEYFKSTDEIIQHLCLK